MSAFAWFATAVVVLALAAYAVEIVAILAPITSKETPVNDISQAHNDGRAELARELDDVFARLLDLVAADVPPLDDPDDHVPVFHLAFQREHDGLWRVKFDDGRSDPPEVIHETPTEALAMLPQFVALEARR